MVALGLQDPRTRRLIVVVQAIACVAGLGATIVAFTPDLPRDGYGVGIGIFTGLEFVALALMFREPSRTR